MRNDPAKDRVSIKILGINIHFYYIWVCGQTEYYLHPQTHILLFACICMDSYMGIHPLALLCQKSTHIPYMKADTRGKPVFPTCRIGISKR
jgi:hypothetical protein